MSQDSEFLPLVGDNDLIRTKALQYKSVAEAIARATASLRIVADTDEMQSKAVDAIRKNAGFVADDISQAQGRYSTTADALLDYASALDTAKSDADTAITQINSAQGDLETAERDASTAEEAANEPGPEQAANQTAATDAATTVTQAATRLSGYEQAWRDARDDKDTAAGIAKGLIEGVVKDSDLNDGLWDNIGSAVKLICDIAGVLAIFLSWVPILGWVLVGLAALGAIIKIIEAAVAVGNGRGTWGDLVGAVVLGVLSVFGGRILSQLGKLSKLSAINKLQGVAGRTTTYAKLQGVAKGSAMSPSAARAAMKEMPKFRSVFNIFGGKAAGLEGGSIASMIGKGGVDRLKFGMNDDLLAIATSSGTMRGLVGNAQLAGLAGLQLAITANSVRGLVGMPGGLADGVSREAGRASQAGQNADWW